MSAEVVLIAALARNRVIGREGSLPWHLPDDLARFKALTLGKAIVMGRKTFDSVGRPLPKRKNIVLSRSTQALEGAFVVDSIERAIDVAGGDDQLWVIGGEAVYAAFLSRADRLELTHVDADVEGDARFPEYDAKEWRVVREEAHPADARHAFGFRYVTSVRAR